MPKSPCKFTGFREIVGAWLLSHLLSQKPLWWQAYSVSIVSGWLCGMCKFDLDYVSEVIGVSSLWSYHWQMLGASLESDC